MNDEEEADGFGCSQIDFQQSSVFEAYSLLNDRLSSNKEAINPSSASTEFPTSFNPSKTQTIKTRTKNGNTWKRNPSFFRHKKTDTQCKAESFQFSTKTFGENEFSSKKLSYNDYNNKENWSFFPPKNPNQESSSVKPSTPLTERHYFGSNDIDTPGGFLLSNLGPQQNDDEIHSISAEYADDMSLNDSFGESEFSTPRIKGTPDNSNTMPYQPSSSSFFERTCLEEQHDDQIQGEILELRSDHKRRKFCDGSFTNSASNSLTSCQMREKAQEESERKSKKRARIFPEKNYKICINFDEKTDEFEQTREEDLDEWLKSVVKFQPKCFKNHSKPQKKHRISNQPNEY